jgi:hypothetical protein
MNNEDFEKAMADFLAKGGVIQHGSYRESGRVEGAAPTNAWGSGKKAGRPPARTDMDPPVEIDDEDDE